MLAPVLVTPPASPVVTLAEVKKHLRVDHADEDAAIQLLIDAAIAYFDGWSGLLGRALVTQEWRQEFDGLWRKDGKLRLPLGPIPADGTVEVTYFDTSNTQQTLASSVYGLFTDALGPYIALKPEQSWPPVYSRDEAASVTYEAGYGDPADVPAAIKSAIILHVKASFDGIDLKSAIDALIGPFRKISI